MSTSSRYMIDPNNQELWKTILRWTNGNQDAARLIFQMYQLARDADDIVDENDNSQETVIRVLETALVHIAGNPFYQKFYGQLSAVVYEILVYWKLGDEFRGSKSWQANTFGFVWRNSVDRVVIVIAALIGGSSHADKVAKELFEISHAQSEETIEDWLEGT